MSRSDCVPKKRQNSQNRIINGISKREYDRKWYHDNIEKQRKRNAERYHKNKEANSPSYKRDLERARINYHLHKDEINAKRKLRMKNQSPDEREKRLKKLRDDGKKRWENPITKERYLSRMKNLRLKRRRDVLQHYGEKCTCCGENIEEFLSIDHINGRDPSDEHYKLTGHNMYSWIIKNGYPPDFQILCHNCNQAKGYYGYCPHKKGEPLIE